MKNQEQNSANVLCYLNSDPEYYKKLKPAPQEKYIFKEEGDRWI